MSEERKAKAAARRAARKEKRFSSFEAKPLTNKPEDTTQIIPKAAELPEMTKYGGELDAATVVDNNKGVPTPIVGKAEIMNPKGISPVDTTTNELVGTAKLEAKLPQGAQQLNPNNTLDIKPRQITISDMLEGQRRKAMQDKTDAAKMQRYYALADAMKALGQMGGAAVGGAIGGNALDSAPAVEKYKESRGYLDAFERAKQANDRLRALDEKEFTLSYNKQLRDEDRKYKEEIADKERQFRAEQAELERKWKTANAAERAKIEQAILVSKQAHEKWLKDRSVEMVKLQMKGKGSPKDESAITGDPIIFDDDSVLYLDKKDLNALKNRFINRKVGDVLVTEENFNEFLGSQRPFVENYLKKIGKDAQFLTLQEEPVVEEQQEEVVEIAPKKSFWQKLAESPQGTAGIVISNNTNNAIKNSFKEDYISQFK